MDNQHLPGQEPEIQEIPLEMEAQEPVIQELTFQKEIPAQEIPLEEALSQDVEDAAILELFARDDVHQEKPAAAEALPMEEELPESQEPVREEVLPAPEEPAVEEELPAQEVPGEKMTEPEPVQEILPNDHAMNQHGMLAHGEEEPPFDMSLLDHPELALPEEEAPQEPLQDQEYQDGGKDFEDLMKTPPAPKPKEELPRMPHKGRPKRKKGEGLLGIPNILVTVVWLALTVAIGVTAGRMLWVCAADVLAFGREDKAVTITIYEADTMEQIVDKLHKAGLIRYKSLFNLYASISDAEEDIQPGIYDLNTRYDYHALVNFMSPRSSREVIKLTIPEGYTNRQIFALLEENRICTAVDLEVYAAEGELEGYWFLEGLEKGQMNRLEGYLFPDTYEFYKNSTPAEAIGKMLDNFNTRFTEEMRLQIEALNANVTGGGYTIREVVIVASLIEKESAAPAESPQIAGVIYNRLFRWEFPALLNIDAAIVYAQNGESDTIDTSLDSPYNTYRNQGLTPTAISNPGLASLMAALNPAAHDFYFYVLNPATGMHQFSTTQAEHDAWIREFYG